MNKARDVSHSSEWKDAAVRNPEHRRGRISLVTALLGPILTRLTLQYLAIFLGHTASRSHG